LSAQVDIFFQTVVPLRWRDLDAYGHVNNSNFLTLLEEARIAWFRTLAGPWRSAQAEPVVARIEINYLKPMMHPANIRATLALERLGNSSLTIKHQLIDQSDGGIYADARTVLVWVDPSTGQSTPLPDSVRENLQR
jgi:acyl-CoA thioester hydrolase